MTRRLSVFIFLYLFCFQMVNVLAQQPPDTINAALAALSEEVGKPVTFEALDNWTFSGEQFPDSSLGCPQPGQMYAQVLTSGVQFLLEFEGVTYDYRVSADGRTVILCGSTEVVPPCPPPDDPAYLPPRLSVGTQGRVVTTGIPNNIRQQPGSSSQLLGEIPPGAVFNVVGGPSCSTLDKIVWWRVDYNGINGWTAEGKDLEYWLEPLNLTGTLIPTPATPQRITPANAAQLTTIADMVNPNGVAALSPDGEMLAILVNRGVQIIDVETNSVIATLTTRASNLPTSVTFDPLGRFLVAGDETGMVRTWLIAPDGSLSDGLQLTGHEGSVSSLAVNPDGTLIASGSATGGVYLWDVGTGTLLTTLGMLVPPVMDVRFSRDGTALMAGGGREGNVVVWRIGATVG